MNEKALNNLKLLDALEYIDDEYIASAARFRMNYEPTPATPPKMTWRTPLKHWRQFVALAACILLLSIASPLVSYIAQVISNFNAGAGSGTTEEISSAPVTDENGVPYTYPMFVDDLEPLTAEEMIKINEAYIQYSYEYLYKIYYSRYQNKDGIDDAEKAAREAARKEADNKRKHTFFNEKYYLNYKYYGMFNNCAVLVIEGSLSIETEYKLAGYVFGFGNSANMYAYKDGKMYDLSDAFDMGLLSDSDIENVYARHTKYWEFEKEWKKSLMSRNGG